MRKIYTAMKGKSKVEKVLMWVIACIGLITFIALTVEACIVINDSGGRRLRTAMSRVANRDDINDSEWPKECSSWQETGEYVPWSEIRNSWYSNGECRISSRKCPGCGNHYRIISYVSPYWTWKEGIGREGEITICPACRKQVSFKLTKINQTIKK